jgi:hypothetical protein
LRAAVRAPATATAHQDAQLFAALVYQIVDLGDLRTFVARTPSATILVIAATGSAPVSSAAAPRAARISSHMFFSLFRPYRGRFFLRLGPRA